MIDRICLTLSMMLALQCCSAFQAGRSPSLVRRSNLLNLAASVPDEIDELDDVLPKSLLDGINVFPSSILDDVEKSTSTTTELPDILQEIVDERREFELNLGKAMDVLQKDYPNVLFKSPDFSIYHDQINVFDPSGVMLSGLGSYRQSFRFVQGIVGMIYDTEKSSVSHRMIYDFARSSIRISWNAVLFPKGWGNRRNALYVSGISIYKLDGPSGKIIEHKVDNLIVNDTPVSPPYGILTSLQGELIRPAGLPAGVGIGACGAYQ